MVSLDVLIIIIVEQVDRTFWSNVLRNTVIIIGCWPSRTIPVPRVFRIRSHLSFWSVLAVLLMVRMCWWFYDIRCSDGLWRWRLIKVCPRFVRDCYVWILYLVYLPLLLNHIVVRLYHVSSCVWVCPLGCDEGCLSCCVAEHNAWRVLSAPSATAINDKQPNKGRNNLTWYDGGSDCLCVRGTKIMISGMF